MCAHGEMHPTFPIHWTHQRCHTISTQPGIMPLMPASSWCLRANKSHSCLSLHLFGKKSPQQPKQTPPSSFLFHNNNTAANCAMLRSGWKCLPDPCVQLVSSQEHEIWLFLPLSSLVQPQVLLSLLHFSDRLFFFPWRLAWTFQSPCSEVPRRGVLPLAAGSSISLPPAFTSLLAPWTSPQACRAGAGVPARAWRWRSFTNDLQKRNLPGLTRRNGWCGLI